MAGRVSGVAKNLKKKMSDAEGQYTVPTTHSGFGGGGSEDDIFL
jgi:hypothetical protein